VNYIDFVEQLKARRPLPFGVVRSMLSGLVLELGSDWGGGVNASRSVYLMPEAKGRPQENQQWRLTADGFFECKERQAASIVVAVEEEAVGEEEDAGDVASSVQGSEGSIAKAAAVCDLDKEENSGANSGSTNNRLRLAREAAAAMALPPLVLSLEGVVEGTKDSGDSGKKDYVVASRRRPAGDGVRRAQRWQLNDTTGEVFSLESGMYLTVKGGVKTIDAKLWVNKCKSSSAQKWALEISTAATHHADGGEDSGCGATAAAAAAEDGAFSWGGAEEAHNPLMGSRF
jgi:hypothetical protein